MADPSEQLFELWKKQLDEGTKAWSRLVGGASPADVPDPAAFWRSLVDQWAQAWSRALAQTPLPPDMPAQWKQLMDQSIEAWSRALGQAMNTEQFAQLLGRSLDQWLAMYGPARKTADQVIEQSLQNLNLASRSQLTAVAKQLVELDERVERVEDVLGTVLRRLDGVVAAVGRLESMAAHAKPGEPA